MRGSTKTLIYDAECRLCTTAKKGIERLGADAHVQFVPYQSDEAVAKLGSEYRQGRPDAAFLIEADGRIRRGLDAFLPLLPGLPGGRILLWMLRVPLLRPLAYVLYRLVAKYRYQWFGSVPPKKGV
jgi:predicted DCC family thiol-disulfide oxidoreductase YuxK